MPVDGQIVAFTGPNHAAVLAAPNLTVTFPERLPLSAGLLPISATEETNYQPHLRFHRRVLREKRRPKLSSEIYFTTPARFLKDNIFQILSFEQFAGRVEVDGDGVNLPLHLVGQIVLKQIGFNNPPQSPPLPRVDVLFRLVIVFFPP